MKKPGKRYPLNMRTTRELRKRVEAAARASGRSLAAEVEYRLEQSIDHDNRLRENRAHTQMIHEMIRAGIRDALDERFGAYRHGRIESESPQQAPEFGVWRAQVTQVPDA
jgi:hypothetical protein